MGYWWLDRWLWSDDFNLTFPVRQQWQGKSACIQQHGLHEVLNKIRKAYQKGYDYFRDYTPPPFVKCTYRQICRRLVSSVGRALDCCAGGRGFKRQTWQTLRVLNNWREFATSVITSANVTFKCYRIRTINHRPCLLHLQCYLVNRGCQGAFEVTKNATWCQVRRTLLKYF